ncbi:HSF-type DNA-binding-domain-containing protein [Peziza echinospora]|nr:HSF-type DNA-binding-domain-containing protein [Peziza echinospora]
MLEDPTYRHIVRWSDTGDSFIVLDNTEFTKNVLPRHFKHSNFASFVRQLNKYDFHKIRNTEETSGSPYGEQAWEFKHPNFQMYNRDQLENIKRKAPAARKAAQQRAAADDGPGLQAAITQIEQLQNQLKVLKGAQKGMDDQLERNDSMCQLLVSQVRDMHKKLIEYEDLIQSLIERLSQKEFETRERVGHQRTLPEVDISPNADGASEPPTPTPSIHPQQPATGGSSTFSPGGTDMTERSELLEVMNVNLYCTTVDSVLLSQPGSALPPRLSTMKGKDQTGKEPASGAPVNNFHLPPMQIRNTPNISLPSLSDVKQELGIAGSQQPRNEKGKARDDPSGNGGRPWPILIVDDDENVRSILCRFFTSMKLEVDCADNGLTAIEKNNQNRYSIIYMDVIMPFLDGVSATRIIRKTDKTTPIICLASTSAESDNSVYQRSGTFPHDSIFYIYY